MLLTLNLRWTRNERAPRGLKMEANLRPVRLVLLCCLLALPGCFLGRASSPKEGYVHKVRYTGETLGLISSWYTRSPGNWRRIARYNGGIDPEQIKIGSLIYVPSELLRRREPMPRSFVLKSYESSGSSRTSFSQERLDKLKQESSTEIPEREIDPHSSDLLYRSSPESGQVTRTGSRNEEGEPARSSEEKKNELLMQLMENK
jgi:hypothetical protein